MQLSRNDRLQSGLITILFVFFHTAACFPSQLLDSTHLQSVLTASSDWLRNFHSDREKRIVETETSVYHVNEAEKLEMKRREINFMDITDHVDFYKELESRNAEKGSKEEEHTTPYPTKPQYVDEIHNMFQNISQSNMQLNLATFSSFFTRYYKSEYGLNASLWLAEKVDEIAKLGLENEAMKDRIKVHTYRHPWGQKSVIATIIGKSRKVQVEASHTYRMADSKMRSSKYDPAKVSKEEMYYHYAFGDVVVVSAHLDSTNLLFPNLFSAPGADDNGSGTVTILEVFRILIESGFDPENTIQFHWYSAEEAGLLGSQAVMTEYKRRGIAVRALLQQDMTGYLGKGISDPNEATFGLMTDYTDPHLTDFMKLVIDEYANITYTEDKCGYGCSDHASANKVGYASAFVMETPMNLANPFIHSVMDTIDRLSFDHMTQHARITLGYVYELGLHGFRLLP